MDRIRLNVALVGDRDDGITAHRALPLALQGAAARLGLSVNIDWLGTHEIADASTFARHDALWSVPGSPYRSEAGALRAIAHARETGLPWVGTCGGFQHAVLEWARHVLGWQDAEHAETAPGARRAVVAPLECPLVEAAETVRLLPGSLLERIWGARTVQAVYRCRFGLDPAFRQAITAGALRVAAEAPDGQVRGLELTGHPFFVAVLFQPERSALQGEPVPLAEALLQAALQRRTAFA